MTCKQVGLLIAKKRNERELSMADVSKKTKISKSHLSNIEGGRRNMSMHAAVALEKALRCKGQLVPLVVCPHCKQLLNR